MRSPNLVFLISDQQQAGTVQPGSICRTPNLDSLAAAGVRFERCYSANVVCSPSRASILTGLLPHSHGVVDCTHTAAPPRADLREGLSFWTRWLKEAGYHQGYFGKWHVERTNLLENFGFDTCEVRGEPENQRRYLEHRQRLGLKDRPELADSHYARHKGYMDLLLYGVTDEPVEATMEHYLFSRGIDFLKEAASRPHRPWALYVSVPGPHDPYVAPGAFYERYDPASIPRPASFSDDLADRPGIYRRTQSVWRDMDWQSFARATACYYAVCTMIDDQVGRLLTALAETGEEEDTVIVYLSDHGDYMGAHRLLLKGIPPFEEVYRVPLIMKGPGLPQGRTNADVVSTMDLAPTLVELLLGKDFPCQGRSLVPRLNGQAGWEQEAFAECHGVRFNYTQRILWRDRCKYVFNGFDEDELYDLESDPHELRNLARDPSSGPLAEEMATRMWEIATGTGDFNLYQSHYGMYRYAPVGPQAAAADNRNA